MPETQLDTPPVVEPVVETPPATPPVVDTPPASEGPKLTILRRGDQVFEPTPPVVDTPPDTPDPVVEVPPVVDTPVVTPPVIEDEEVDFFPFASEQTNGVIKTPEDVFAIVEERNQLKKQLAEKPKIEFPSEQAKWLYEQAVKFPGKEVESYRSMLHVLSLDVTKLSDKDKQFEAFALEYKNLPRDEARKYFDAKYEKNFGEGILESDVTAQFDHKIQTQKAEETLAKMQEEFNKMEPSKPAAPVAPLAMSTEELNAVKVDVNKVLGQFGGMKYQFFDNDPDSVVSVPLEDADLPSLESYMTDPRTFFEDLTKECTDSSGDFSMDQLAMAMFEFKNRARIREQAFASGVTYGKLQQIKAAKNTSTPPPAATPGQPAAPKTFQDAFKDAVLKGKKPTVKP